MATRLLPWLIGTYQALPKTIHSGSAWLSSEQPANVSPKSRAVKKEKPQVNVW